MSAANAQRKIAQPKIQQLPVGHAIQPESKSHESIVESTPMKFVKPLFILVLSCFLSACGTAPGAAADTKARGDRAATPVRQVQTAIAEEKGIDQLVVVSGTLGADQEVVL